MKFEVNWTKIKGGYQFGRKEVAHDSKSDLLLEEYTDHHQINLPKKRNCLASLKQTSLPALEFRLALLLWFPIVSLAWIPLLLVTLFLLRSRSPLGLGASMKP